MQRLSCHKNQIAVTINPNILGYEGLFGNGISDDVHSGKSVSDHTIKGAGLGILAKYQLLPGLIHCGSRKERSKVTLPLGSSYTWQTLRFASTNAARTPQFDSGNEHEDDQDRQRDRKALIEDRVDSTSDLGLADASSKAKDQEQSSMKQKSFASSRGISHAMKIVPSMISNKKDEFLSALLHYWLGLRLLGLDVRISSRLMLKIANGKKLLRRERNQLTRTTADIFKLVPFSVFVVVPFMELCLPLFLRLFPNMQPSTFKNKMLLIFIVAHMKQLI